MGILDSVFGKKSALPNSIRETLFGDMPLAQWPLDGSLSAIVPWNMFLLARSHLASGRQDAACECWQQVIEHPGLEPRQYAQAWTFLRQNGKTPAPDVAKQVLGVVVEVALRDGLDVVAAYPDHSARYYHNSGAGVVWEHPDSSLDRQIEEVVEAAKVAVARIGPWTQARPSPPPRGQARLSFLTPSGLHFGQGKMGALERDQIGGPVLHTATVLMQALAAKTRAGMVSAFVERDKDPSGT